MAAPLEGWRYRPADGALPRAILCCNRKEMPNMLTDMSAEPHPSSAIISIEVEGLFGWLSYKLPSETAPAHKSDLSRLLILYGDNGSGKTTLLTLIHSALTPDMKQGHRSRLASIPFKRFSVGLANGMAVEAIRRGNDLRGDYIVRFIEGGETVEECFIQANDEFSVKNEPNENALAVLEDRLRSLKLHLRFLRDDRRTERLPPFRDLDEWPVDPSDLQRLIVRQRIQEGVIGAKTGLAHAIDRLESWIRQSALSGSTLGDQNINSVYTDVVRRIAMVPIGGNPASESDRYELISTLNHLTKRSEEFAAYRLTSRLQVEELVDLVKATPDEAINLLGDVLKPYLTGVTARLDALEEVKVVLDRLVQSINALLRYKHVRFDLRTGLEVVAIGDVVLEPSDLSSGEQQLLLLVAEAVVYRGDQTVFIIDEPEISLNVKWQRRLIETLLQCIGEGPVQLIVATHSIELLNKHKHNVLRLEPDVHG